MQSLRGWNAARCLFIGCVAAITGVAQLPGQSKLRIDTTSLPSGYVGVSYSQSLSGGGGRGPYVWSLSAGSLPGGVALSTSGTISGKPVAVGPNSFTVQLKDSSNATVKQALSIQVNPSVTVSTTTLPGGTAGVAYSQALTATGGLPPFQWTLASGTLPAGLSLSTSGTLSGTPLGAGSSSFSVEVTDANSSTDTQSLTLQVAGGVTITTTSLPAGAVGDSYSQTLSATGGLGVYIWTVSAGSLPGGIGLSATGTISGTPSASGTFNFTVKAVSGLSSATKALSIAVNPALSVTTSSLPGGTTGSAYSQTLAASGGTGEDNWTISAGRLPAGLSLSSAGVISGTPTAAGTSNFTVQVADNSGGKASAPLTIVVSAPLSVTTSSLPKGVVGTAYSQTLAASGGTGGYSWTVSAGTLPTGLSLSSAGVINGTPSAAGTSNFTAQVADSSGAKATAPLTVVVTAALSVTTSSLPNGVVGTAYSQTLAASGGTGGYTWTVSAGSLPAGLSLSSAGVISGTPSAAGTSNFTVQVADSSEAKAGAPLTVAIGAGLTITTSSLPNGIVGTAYSQTLAASGGTGGYTWTVSAGSLPASLSLSSAGVISGTPSAAGTSNFTVQVADSSGAKASAPLTIAIGTGLTITTSSLPNGIVGTAYSQTLAATGGTGGNAWTVSAGSLPAGLSLSSAGVIGGNPSAAGSSSFTVQVADSSGAKASAPLSIAIGAGLTITTSSLPNGIVGTAYSQTLAATGGTGGNAWTVSAGSLPAGLSLSSAGVISGTPSAAGNSSFTVQLADSSGAKASAPLTIAIGTGLTITTSSLPNGIVGTAYSQTLAATGGTGGNTWTVSVGSLPAGLSLSSAGVISGTPSAAGNSSFTVQLADSSGAKASAPLTIAIGTGLTITTSSLPNGIVGTAYSQTLAATGGTGGNTWTVSVGSLPAGLSLNSAGVIGGTPSAAGTSNFTVQVADSSGAKASAPLTIAVGAGVSITISSLPNGIAGALYSQPIAASGGTGVFTWTMSSGTLPPGLALASTGTISGTPSTAGTWSFTVQVMDTSGAKANGPLSITVSPGVTVTTPSLPNGIAGTPYSQTLGASGGTGPYTWSVGTGALPAGLSLSGSGIISGTPSAAGSTTFSLQVTDTLGGKASATFTIIVAQALTVTTPAGLATGGALFPYSQTFTAAGGVPPYSWQVSGTLPAGLALSAAGTLSGTPTQVGTFSFSVKVTDKAGSQASGSYSVVIASGLAISTAPVLPTAETGVAYSATLQAVGGTSPYQWVVTAGSLPGGLNFSGTGVISGTPSASGAFTFTAQVTDGNTNQATKQFTLTVNGALSISSTTLPAGSTLSTYDQTLTASGGQPPYSWSVTGGALPAGLSLQGPTGTLIGVPSNTGNFSFAVTVTDANGGSAQAQLALSIAAGISVTSPASLPAAITGNAYSYALQASGGQAPYTWIVSQGSLPGGLTLNAASGQISGTPSVPGASSFTIQVSDAAKNSTTQVESIVIAIPNLPAISIVGFSGSMQPLQQPQVNISLAAPFPVQITGTLSLSFTPAGPNPVDDPAVQFSTGGRSATFTIPPNGTQATFGVPQFGVQTGSVAGTTTISIVSLQAGGASLSIPDGSSQTVQVSAVPPIITTMAIVHIANGFQLQITGAANTRDLTQVGVTFQPSAGANLQTSQLTIPLTDTANGWFQSSSSAQYGGQFTLTVPFNFTGSVSLSSVSAVLTSSAGNSAPASAGY